MRLYRNYLVPLSFELFLRVGQIVSIQLVVANKLLTAFVQLSTCNIYIAPRSKRENSYNKPCSLKYLNQQSF